MRDEIERLMAENDELKAQVADFQQKEEAEQPVRAEANSDFS